MDKAAIKLLLESYRPQDADDPEFAEALRAAATDPELGAWFAERQRFDAVMVSRLQEVVVPARLKQDILLGCQETALAHGSSRFAGWAAGGAIAAMLIAALFAWRFFALTRRPGLLLAQQAISYTEQMPPLQFVCFDAKAVAAWINRQNGTQQVGLHLPPPPDSLSMAMIGSSVVDWKGHPVVMVCLQNGRQMAMLYILKASEAADLPDGATETVQQANWVVRTTKSEGQVRILATKGRPEDLNFQMPF